MKYVLVVLMAVLSCPAYGAWYVVNTDNNVVAICNYIPAAADLETRNEIAVWSDEGIDLTKAEYRNGKIIRHVKTAREIEAEAEIQASLEEEVRIKSELRALALERLGGTAKMAVQTTGCNTCTEGDM